MRLDIEGVCVDFPFTPYELQTEYMRKVIQALNSGEHALLESPTGTGKTLSLLCAALAWRANQADKLHASQALNKQSSVAGEYEKQLRPPTIIYASRTLSQISQVVNELKNTSYSPKVAILSSRDHMCVNPMVNQLSSSELRYTCKIMSKQGTCKYKGNLDSFVTSQRGFTVHSNSTVLDIEELLSFGRANEVCPYFLSRLEQTQLEAELVFLPYNYLFDPSVRTGLNVIWTNAVVIIDEAHNIEAVCDQAASAEISSGQLANCLGELDQMIEILKFNKSAEDLISLNELLLLKKMILNIEQSLSNLKLHKTEIGIGSTFKGGYLVSEIFRPSGITVSTAKEVVNLIARMVEFQPKASNLDHFRSMLLKVFPSEGMDPFKRANDFFRVYARQKEYNIGEKGSPGERLLSFWCFSPGVALKNLTDLGVSSIILTSGTLAPLTSFGAQLQIPFEIQLENPHVVKADQVWVGVLKSGVTGKRLNSTFRFRNTDEYKREIGSSIASFARIVPDGILVFFPSYVVMTSCIEFWKRHGIDTRIAKHKEIIVEPKSSNEMKREIERYYESIDKGRGAVFLAVCRGKASEGIDFSNQKARGVVITGLPYPPKNDPRVNLKSKFLDNQQASLFEKLTGNQWYSQQATRAVNQAIGRVIRHRLDYGAIILCDERFAYEGQKRSLSMWLQSRWHVCSSFGEAFRELSQFYKSAKCKFPTDPSSKAHHKNLSDRSTKVNEYNSMFGSRAIRRKERHTDLDFVSIKATDKPRRNPIVIEYDNPHDAMIKNLYAKEAEAEDIQDVSRKRQRKRNLQSAILDQFSMSRKTSIRREVKENVSLVDDGLNCINQKQNIATMTTKQQRASEFLRFKMRENSKIQKQRSADGINDPSRQSETTKRLTAAEFLSRCKAILNKKEYTSFKRLLTELNTMPKAEGLEKIFHLLSGDEKEFLRRAFTQFVPKRLRREYESLLQC